MFWNKYSVFEKITIISIIILVFINIILFYAIQIFDFLSLCLELRLPQLLFLVIAQFIIQFKTNKSEIIKLLTAIIFSNLISAIMTYCICNIYIGIYNDQIRKCVQKLHRVTLSVVDNREAASIICLSIIALTVFLIAFSISYCLQYHLTKKLKFYKDENQISYLTFKANLLSYFILYIGYVITYVFRVILIEKH